MGRIWAARFCTATSAVIHNKTTSDTNNLFLHNSDPQQSPPRISPLHQAPTETSALHKYRCRLLITTWQMQNEILHDQMRRFFSISYLSEHPNFKQLSMTHLDHVFQFEREKQNHLLVVNGTSSSLVPLDAAPDTTRTETKCWETNKVN